MDPIRVIYHHEPEGWWAESPDIEGWYATGATFEATRALAEDHARYATERDDIAVEHYVPAGARVPA